MPIDRINELKDKTDKHNIRLDHIEHTLAQTPDPETLRHVEHVIDELPPTDDLKDCVKARNDRSAAYKKVFWAVAAVVFGTLATAFMSIIWNGIAHAIKAVD